MRGSVLDTIYIVVSLFAMGLLILVLYTIIATIDNTGVLNNVTMADGRVIINNVTAISDAKNTLALFDTGFIFMAVMFALAGVMLAYLTPSEPIFFVFGLFFTCFSVIIAGPLSNAWDTIIGVAPFTATAAVFTNITAFMHNLPLFAAVASAMMLIALYAKGRTQGASFG